MATLAGQRATFTWALNRYNSTDDVDRRTKFVKQMAKTIATAPSNGFTIEEVTQGQSYPALEVEKYLRDPAAVAVEPGISEEESSESLAKSVEATDVIRAGQGNGTVYAYGYMCAPDRLKVGSTDGDAVQRIAAQISTSTPDRPVLVIEIKTDTCRALERAMHGILETRGRKISGGGTEWFKTTRDELMEIYQFICKN